MAFWTADYPWGRFTGYGRGGGPEIFVDAVGRTTRTCGGALQTICNWEAVQQPGRRGPRRGPRVIIDDVPGFRDYDYGYPRNGPRIVHYHNGPTIGPNIGTRGMRFGDIRARRRQRHHFDMMDMMDPWMVDDDEDDFDDDYDEYDSDDVYEAGFGGGGGRRYLRRANAGVNMHRLGGGAPRAMRMLDWRADGGAGFGRQRQGAREFAMY